MFRSTDTNPSITSRGLVPQGRQLI